MKRNRFWILCLISILINILSGCIKIQPELKPIAMETQSNGIWTKDAITVLQNQTIPCTDVISEITSKPGYTMKIITITYQGETSTIKTAEKFMDLKQGVLTVRSIPEAVTLKNEKQVPNITFTFNEVTKEPQLLTISIVFETETKETETQTAQIWISVQAESEDTHDHATERLFRSLLSGTRR